MLRVIYFQATFVTKGWMITSYYVEVAYEGAYNDFNTDDK